MRYAFVYMLVLIGCADALPTAPAAAEPEAPVPVVRFVGTCDHWAVWWLRRGTEPLTAGDGIHSWPGTDSLEVIARPDRREILWGELDATGRVLQLHAVQTDSLGATRIVASCR